MTKHKTTAVDIVIIPPLKVQKTAITINRKTDANNIRLGIFENIPHITLLMGGVLDTQLDEFVKIASKILKNTDKFEVEIFDYYNDERVSGLEVRITEDLLRLHKNLMDKLSPFIKTDNTIDCLFEHKTADPISLNWVNGFKDKYSLENYFPHVTLGKVKVTKKDLPKPIKFTTKHFGIYQLGNYCTCTNLIKSFEL